MPGTARPKTTKETVETYLPWLGVADALHNKIKNHSRTATECIKCRLLSHYYFHHPYYVVQGSQEAFQQVI